MRTSLTYESGRGATMSAVATLPTSIRSGFGKTSIPRMTVRITTSASAAPPSRVTSRRLSGTTGSIAWFSIGRPSGSVPAVSWATRSAAARDCATSAETCLPSARPRVRGASQPMTLPRSRADDAPVAAMPSSTRAWISASESCSGRYSERIAISASSFAARSSRPPFRNASTDSRRVFTSRARTAA